MQGYFQKLHHSLVQLVLTENSPATQIIELCDMKTEQANINITQAGPLAWAVLIVLIVLLSSLLVLFFYKTLIGH